MHTKTASVHAPVCRHWPRLAAGVARLEFALTVTIAGVIAAFALNHISHLQVLAQQAVIDTKAAQMQSLAALAQARCAISPSLPSLPALPTASAPVPKPVTYTLALQRGVASEVEPPAFSCP